MIGVVSDPIFMRHDTGGFHPEDPQRVHYIHTLFAGADPDILKIESAQAGIEDVALNHDRDYIDEIYRTCCSKDSTYLDSDTVCSEDSYDVSLLAAGSLIKLTRMTLNSEINYGFASLRPPGHHATHGRAMGFCIFNNIAIAARKARALSKKKKVLIVDFDVHHGNGTQDSFYEEEDVLYFSSHQYPFYPGTGSVSERGMHNGEGVTVNCPMSAGKTDGNYMTVYKYILTPIIQAYKPGIILVSAGFDAHAMDPIASMRLSSECFGALALMIKEAADKVGAPVIYSLEGGYNLNALRDSVSQVIQVMKGVSVPKIEPVSSPELDKLVKEHSRLWPQVG